MTTTSKLGGEDRYLPSWVHAKDAMQMTAEDGTVHFSHLKKISDSGVQYLHSLSTPFEASRAMLIGTGVHHLVLGRRPTAKVAFFDGDKRAGAAWKEFAAAHPGYDILTAPEWAEAMLIAEAVKADPVAREYLEDARFEVPLTWEDSGLRCSTTGVDIVQPGRIGDLKTTSTTAIEAWKRQAFSFSYHCQMAWYRRGCVANGIDVSRGMFLLGVDTKPPFEVVVLEMSEELIDLAERTLTLWVERLKVYMESRQFPGRAQSAVVWTVPSWMQESDDDDS